MRDSPRGSSPPPRFNDAYITTRDAHVEDWVALLVANHLFAGADAFVAANLWDVPARLGLRVSARCRTAPFSRRRSHGDAELRRRSASSTRASAG